VRAVLDVLGVCFALFAIGVLVIVILTDLYGDTNEDADYTDKE